MSALRPKVGDLLLWTQPEQDLCVGMRVTEFRDTEIVGDPTDKRHPGELRWDPAGLFDGRIVAAKKCEACRGRGWHVGECHPQETCGACDGQGVVAQ